MRLQAPLLLDKLKDKAAVVVRAAGEALAAMHKCVGALSNDSPPSSPSYMCVSSNSMPVSCRYCFQIADVAEDVVAALGHQNPKVRENALGWLRSCLECETKQGGTRVSSGAADDDIQRLGLP